MVLYILQTVLSAIQLQEIYTVLKQKAEKECVAMSEKDFIKSKLPAIIINLISLPLVIAIIAVALFVCKNYAQLF